MVLPSDFDPSNITIVIPTKNEAGNIEHAIQMAQPFCGQLIVVDARSDDGTADLAKKAGAVVITQPGKGKGNALKASTSHVLNPITVYFDADGSHDPKDIPKMVAEITSGRADHVSGSRLLGGSSELHGGFDEFIRLSGSSFITACINKRFGVRLSDSQNGFRAIRTDVLKNLELGENHSTCEQEMIIKTLKKGYRLVEIPAHEHRRRTGVSKILVTRVWHYHLFSLIKNLWRSS